MNRFVERRATYLGHTVTLDSLAGEADLEDLVDFSGEGSSTRRDIFNISTEQVSNLDISIFMTDLSNVKRYLSEDQSVVYPMSDFSGRPPIVQFGVDGLLQQSTLESTSS